MKRNRMVGALLAGMGLVSLAYAPVRADHGNGGQQEIRLRTSLTGPRINHVTPEGNAEFRSRDRQKQFKTEVEDVNLDNGTKLAVQVDGAPVGNIFLRNGRGELELNTENGKAVPAVQKGSVVTVSTADGVTVESGTF